MPFYHIAINSLIPFLNNESMELDIIIFTQIFPEYCPMCRLVPKKFLRCDIQMSPHNHYFSHSKLAKIS